MPELLAPVRAPTRRTLTDAATIANDWATFPSAAEVTLGGNRTLGNPDNAVADATRYVWVKGDGGSARTLSFGANFKGDLPTLNDVTNAKWYLLTLVCHSPSHVVVASVRAL